MDILSKQIFDTRDELKEWLEDLDFTVEYYGGTSGTQYTRMKYNLDETETWIQIDRLVNNTVYIYAIALYNNGILISNGLKMDSDFYAAIAPENDGDTWVCQASWAYSGTTYQALSGDLLVQQKIPNSGLKLSHDSIKLEQYYDDFTEEITPNKYFLNIIPYRSLQWIYYAAYLDYRRFSSHIPSYYRDFTNLSPGQIVEVTINEKKFLLIIRGYENDTIQQNQDDSFYGSKWSVALRLP